jgi:hypothetical protein
MGFRFNPTTGLFDLVGGSSGSASYIKSFIPSDWVSSGDLYYIDVVHNLGTSTPGIVFSGGDMVHEEQITNNNTIRLLVTHTFTGYVQVTK